MITRRTVVLSIPPLLVSAKAFSAAATFPQAFSGSKYIAAAKEASEVVIAGDKEPGERLVVNGKVTDAKKKPLAGVSIYIFQADAAGHYATRGKDEETNARLNGLVRTDAQGQFTYSTVRPGSHGDAPQAIRYVISAPGLAPQMRELWFWDDPIIEDRVNKNQPEIPKSYPEGMVTIVPAIRNTQRILRSIHNIVL